MSNPDCPRCRYLESTLSQLVKSKLRAERCSHFETTIMSHGESHVSAPESEEPDRVFRLKDKDRLTMTMRLVYEPITKF